MGDAITPEGLGIDVHLGALLELGSHVKALNDTMKEWLKGDVVFQQPIWGQLSASGTLDGGANSNTEVPRGLCWSIRRLSATGFTAGTVTALFNAIEPVEIFAPTTAPQKYARGAMLMQPGDRLVFNATGITGSVIVFGVADTFPTWYLRKYLD